MTRALWQIVFGLCVAAFSCGDDGVDEPADAGAPDAGGKAGSGGSGGGGSGGSGGSGGRPSGQCVVDFPCHSGGGRCVGERQLQRYRNKPCEEVCGDRLPCSGGSCVRDGDIVECPEGQRCRGRLPYQFGVGQASCVSIDSDACDGDGGVNDQPYCPTELGCGDGLRDHKFQEGCDDGNREDGDGCSRNCTLEDGYDCGRGPCVLTRADLACSDSACKQGSVCVEMASGEGCACSEQVRASCPSFALQSLPLNDVERFDVHGMSGDGTTVFAPDATWTLEQGVRRLSIDFEQNAVISAISEDGRTSLLNRDASTSGGIGSSVRLRDGAVIGTSGLGMFYALYDLDDSGDVIVGDYFVPTADGDVRYLLRWENGTNIKAISKLLGSACDECNPRSNSPAISGDGKVIVGDSDQGPFRWSEATGKQMLSVDGGTRTYVMAVSRDGSFVLGRTVVEGGARPVRWNAEGEAELLPLPAFDGELLGVWPNAISADGRVVVGELRSDKPLRSIAFIWDETHGTRALTAAISGASDLANWQLFAAYAVSSDGRTVVGNGSYRSRGVAYIAHVEAP